MLFLTKNKYRKLVQELNSRYQNKTNEMARYMRANNYYWTKVVLGICGVLFIFYMMSSGGNEDAGFDVETMKHVKVENLIREKGN